MRCGRLRLPAVAAAAALPTLLAGMLVAPSPAFLVGPSDSTVRTVNVPPPPALALSTDEALGLDGAHPTTDPVPRLQDAMVHQTPGPDDNRAVPVRVSGTALPARVLIAYRRAADALAQSDPGCHLTWSLVAGIGKVESGHASGGAVDRAGRTLTPILGPVLDGAGAFAAISDSDGGRWDGDTTWDRAVGPMQFIPSSWSVWGRDGDGDGEANPSDIDDAALATASYLCAGDRDLRVEKDRRSAVFSYNHSWDYVDLVLAWADAYATGAPVQTGALVAFGGPDATLPLHGRPASTAGPATAVDAPTAPASGPVAAAPATSEPQAPASAAPTESGPVATEAPAATPEPAPSSSAPPSSEPSPSTSTGAPPPCPTETATASPTPTGTADPAPTPTPSETATPAPSPSPTGTDPTGTATPTSTATPTPTGCPTPSPTPTP